MDKADEEAIRRIELGFNEALGRHDTYGMVDGQWRTVAVQNTDVRPGRRH
jgi:hypothetical protein